MHSFLKYICIALFIPLFLSCTKTAHEKKIRDISALSFKWSAKVDSLLHDTSKTRRFVKILKLKILQSGSDTDAINNLNQLASKSGFQAIYFADEARKQSQKIGYTYGLINSLCERARYFIGLGKADSGERDLQKAAMVAQKSGSERLVAQELYWKGEIYFDHSEFKKAVDILNEAENAADSSGYKPLIADCLAALGDASRMDYNYFDALGYYNRAIQAANEINDSARAVNCILSVGEVYSLKAEYTTALFYYDYCLKMVKNSKNKAKEAYCLYSFGQVYKQQSDNVKALDYFGRAIETAMEVDDQKDIAASYSAIASIYTAEAEYAKSLEYFNKAVKIETEIDNKEGLDYVFLGIGDIYRQQRDFENAVKYYGMAMDMAKEVGNKGLYNTAITLLGKVYGDQGNFVEALNYYNKVIGLAEAIEDDGNLGDCLFSIGQVYSKLQYDDEALGYFNRALEIGNRIKSKHLIASCLCSIGNIYMNKNSAQKAKQYAAQSLEVARESGEPVLIQNAAGLYSQAAKNMGDFKNALAMHELYSKTKDSATNVEEVKRFSTMEYTTKEEQLKMQAEKTKEIFAAEQSKNEAELKRQRTLRYTFTFGFLLVLVFMVVIFRALQQNKRKTLIITQQKEEVEKQRAISEQHRALAEEKNKEVLDSITYAKRLQDAILPPIKLIEQLLPDSFIIYKPKAIVAGDFYWLEKCQTKNSAEEVILIAAADCTGHGVPGAMVSVVCSNALNRAVKEFHLTEPGKILDKTRDLVLDTFAQRNDTHLQQAAGHRIADIKDGMDISLLAICNDRSANGSIKVEWSGANSPLWYIQDNEMKVIVADKQPIGRRDKLTPFTTHTLYLNKGDTIYLFSDGYADQFGGNEGKKFKSRQLQAKLKEMTLHTLKEQGEQLYRIFETWRGSLEQVDDVLMIGIKV